MGHVTINPPVDSPTARLLPPTPNHALSQTRTTTTSVLCATIANARVSLKPTLGLFNAVSVIVGIIIGSGIFVSPKGVLIHAGSVGSSLIIWTISGIFALIGGLCYMELGVLMPVSGGDYYYIQKNYGPFVGFLYVWTQVFIIFPTSNAIVAMTFAKYFLQPIFNSCCPPENLEQLVAAFAIILLSAINCGSVKWATRVQDIFGVAKVFALLVIICYGLISLASPRSNFPTDVDEVFADSKTSAASLSLALYQGVYSYAGFNYLNFLMGELKSPERNLPLAIVLAIPLITFIYVMTNVAYFSILTPYIMLESEASALSFADRTLGSMAWIMSLFVSLSCFGGLNGCILSSSRMFFAAARKGHLPDVLSLIHVTSSTPVPAIIFECILSLAMLAVKDIYQLINYMTFAEFLFIGISISIVPYLRWKKPKLKRPVSVPLPFALFFILVCIFLIIVPLVQDPQSNSMGLAMIALGIPVYWFGVLWKHEDKPKFIQQASVEWTQNIQKIFLVVPEDSGESKEPKDD